MANISVLVSPPQEVVESLRRLAGDRDYAPALKWLKEQRIELALKSTRYNAPEQEVRMRQVQGAVQLLGDLISLIGE